MNADEQLCKYIILDHAFPKMFIPGFSPKPKRPAEATNRHETSPEQDFHPAGAGTEFQSWF
jgi:hypothetical protein